MRRDSSGTKRSACRRATSSAVLATVFASAHLFAQSPLPPAAAVPDAAAPAAPAGNPATPAPPAAPAPTSAVAPPIAIVPLAGNAGQAPTVSGALEVTGDKAIIAVSGAVSSGSATTQVTLPNRGVLHVCASTTVKLAADNSVPTGETPGLLMALDRGALEADFTTGPNSDMVLTPDFRILISGPGAANLKLRLGAKGDTCIDNAGVNAPYVLVTSLFGDGTYRVQPGQRVLFEHGSVHDVVDKEMEPCGCPPAVKPGSNEFPLAQSEGLAPLARPAPAPPPSAEMHLPLVYNSSEHAPKAAASMPAPASANSAPAAPAARKARPKRGFFRSVGRFFRRVFGAD
ncbi:MAG: hypothetical protein ACRD25_01415 [Terracidiphilus sp.]